MTACKSGIHLLAWVCVLISSGSVESLEWTSEPVNPTKVAEGQNVALTWNYSLTLAEQTSSDQLYSVEWFKFNLSISEYFKIAAFNKFNGVLSFSQPNAPHIVVGQPVVLNSATLKINDVTINDEGLYKITYLLFSGKINESEVNLTVLVPAGIAHVTGDQVVCEGSLVTLNCNATGIPTPNITWTKVEGNSTDSAPPLPAVDGKYVLRNIQRSANGTYRCTADNGVGVPVNRTVSVKVEYSPAVKRIVNSSNSVNEGQSFNMTCMTSDPEPNVYWIKENNGARINGSVLTFTNINRNDSGQYRCEAKNDCGNDSSVQSIEVFYKPDNVELLTNTTEDSYCSDLWVNFTCKASDANPAVSNYVLYEHNNSVASNNNGTWILKLSEGKKHVYHCVTEQFVENVTSTNNVTISVNVSASVNIVNTKIFTEGDDAVLFCNVSGVPLPVASWFNDKNENVYNGSPWKLPSVNRSYNGTYKCEASNGCGMDSKTIDIIVQYEPDDVRLKPNITNSKVCAEYTVNFTCSADANPAVDSYTLFKNGSVVNTSSLALWSITMNTAGQFVYRCEANNSVGSGKSSDVTFNVEVPAKVINVNTTIFTEGEDAILFCNVSGVPPPVVSWFNEKNENVYNGSLWQLLSINRSYNGTYQCIASNACRMDSKPFDIIVQHKPEGVRLSPNITNNPVCAGYIVNFTCSANANPAVDSYTLFENGSAVNTSSLGVWSITMNTAGRFVYRCEANNSVGFNKSTDVIVNVEVSASVISVNTTDFVEGKNVILFCNVSGVPDPSVSWINVTSMETVNDGAIWRLPNISRNNDGMYKCRANNTCNEDNKMVDIVVQYPPTKGPYSAIVRVIEGTQVTLSCPVDGRPEPNITWYKGNDTTAEAQHQGREWTFPAESNGAGWYNCSAKNFLNLFEPVNVSFQLIVDKETTASPTNPSSVDTERIMKITLEIKDGDCNNFTEVLQERVRNETFRWLEPFGITDVKIRNISCGSVIVDLELSFTQSVTVDQVVKTLKKAASRRDFGGFNVDPESIRETGKAISTTGAPTSGTTEPLCQESFIKKADCSVNVVIVAVLVVVAVIVVAFVAGVIGWWIHKRRKCLKDPRIHHSESEVLHDQNDIEDGAYARVNGGYADSGPPSANGTAQPKEAGSNNTDVPAEQAAAAPPAYAVVDKSKKKDKDKQNIPDYAVVDKSKKKKKKPEVEDPYAEVEDPKKDKDKKTTDPSTRDYAMVDKSKKKKKETDENAYATVDKSKKSKKGQQKPKAPGEVLYADLGDFQPVQPLPTVSTSPEPLAPVKRPTPYQGTEYADITQFLKGNATLPEGQSTEMQPTYANAGGGQGAAANKENANTGGEGGGGDTEPKETPM